jgi:hypothetical protein
MAQCFRLAQATPEFGVVKGRWVRPDGGYTIVIKGVDPGGRMDATYFNPDLMNASKAEVSGQGGALRVFLELRGAGYPGSTYTLTYEPRSDTPEFIGEDKRFAMAAHIITGMPALCTFLGTLAGYIGMGCVGSGHEKD